MKRHLLLVLLVFFILADGFGSLFRPALPKRLDVVPPSADCGLQSAGERAFSFAVRQLASADWLRPAEPLDLVPQDALLLIDMANAAAAAMSFAASPPGRAVSTADWPSALELQEDLTAFLVHPLMQELFSRRAALALLNPDSPPPQDGSGQAFWLEHLLLIVQPGPDSSPAALMALLQPERQQTIYYQGIAVQALELKGDKKLHAALVGGRLLLSPGLEPVRTAIDLFLRRLLWKQTGLPLNPDYAAVKTLAAGRDDFFLHMDLARLSALLSLPALARSVDFFHQRDGQTDRFSAVFRFLPGQPPGAWAGTPPVRNRSIGRMPAGLLLHFWSNWLLPGCWLQAVPTQEDELAAADVWLKEKGGLGLDEVLGLFGQEFSFSVSGISTDGLLPVPRLSLLAEVTDQRKAERFLGQMTAGLPVRREPAAGVPLVSLLAAKGLMQPSYAFADGLFLLADSREQIEDILSDSSAKLVGSALFQAVNTGLDQPANLTLFVRPAELAEGLKGLAAWAGPLLGKQSRISADQFLPPLLEGLKMFEAAGLRSTVRPGELVVEAAVLRAGN